MNQQKMENNVNQQPGLDSFLKTWWQSHLFGTKLILTISSIFGLIDLFTHYAFDILSNSPDSTIPFQIQRLFFANFVHYYSIDMILAIICISNRLKDFETKNGTVQFIIIIFIQGFITQSICLLLQFVFSFIYPPFSQAPAYSLWNFAIFFIIQDCLMIPNGQSKFLIFPMQLKNKYYPILFIVLFSLIQQSLTFISSSIVAVIYYLYSDNFNLLPATVQKMENGIIFKHFIEQIDFKRITNYQDQIEFSVDSREIPQIQTPPAKLTIEGSAPFPPSLLLQELQKQLNTKGGKIRERVQEVEEQKQMEQKTEEYDL
ncbi:unnamed protein product (macronuclear) [Paramecium tetraurelia]|uniref:Peptidase S54 rhomboid domain-containing protein n=1 Tax=Paramecium tetraurelia TaxID=5888 RepID=A0DBL0_PARTE|nr:uncharacterized protein GSPATT00015323001 [Paramecium tetraurelia]CAK80427.1 unnamed protein product [Paramecium tetraurelia]|eukprot:XP_001447824.1 hypothetical protein (macronuclear) [Paramecium tetraurelia strain d4-2]